MELDDSILEKLRLRYGKIQPISYLVPGKNPGIIVVRKPNFSEYLLFNKYAEVTEGDSYELDPEVTDSYLKAVLVYPEDIDIIDIPAGIIVKACAISIKLSEFEDINRIRDLYIKSIRNFNTQAGSLLAKLIAAYGIQGYQLSKNMNEEEIIDLLVAAEVITNTYGEFAKITNLPNMPFVPKTKKLDIDRILGIQSNNTHDINKLSEQKRNRLTAYYQSLGYTNEQIMSIIDKIESGETRKEFQNMNPETNGKIDMSQIDDKEIETMTARQFNELRKEGKIMSADESRNKALNEAKSSLAMKIAEDKAKYGSQVSKQSSGNIQNIINNINSVLKTMD